MFHVKHKRSIVDRLTNNLVESLEDEFEDFQFAEFDFRLQHLLRGGDTDVAGSLMMGVVRFAVITGLGLHLVVRFELGGPGVGARGGDRDGGIETKDSDIRCGIGLGLVGGFDRLFGERSVIRILDHGVVFERLILGGVCLVDLNDVIRAPCVENLDCLSEECLTICVWFLPSLIPIRPRAHALIDLVI